MKVFFCTLISICVTLTHATSPLPQRDVFKACDGGFCVPHYTCQNETVRISGVGVVDIRFDAENQCGHYLEICCAPEHFKPPTRPTSIQPPKNEVENFGVNQLCGFRNIDGVGFHLTGHTGKESQFGEFPWMVAVLEKETVGNFQALMFKCGGSIIFPYVVMTGAHCIFEKDPANIVIRAGEWDSQTTNEIYPHSDYEVREIVIHKDFKRGGLHNNIALIFLKNSVATDLHVSPICLSPKDATFDFKKCVASGWGKDMFGKNGTYQVILKKIELPIVPQATCQKKLQGTRLSQHFQLHESFVCAGGEEGIDTCTGDGGSPLVCPMEDSPGHYHQVGIVAWGIGCGEQGLPGVYVNVPYFRDWIDYQVKKQEVYTEHFERVVV